MKGSIRERDKGVWELRVSLGKDAVTGRYRQTSKTFRGGKREAQRELAKLITDVSDGHHGGSNATVAQLMDIWLRDAEQRPRPVSPTTLLIYRDMAKIVKNSSLASVRLRRIGVYEVDKALGELRTAGLSTYRLIQVRKYFSAAMQLAENWGWVRTNPVRGSRKVEVPKKKPKALTLAEVHTLVAATEAEDPDLAAMMTLGYLTGLRRGALCGLRWSDVDWEGGQLVLRRSLVIAGGRVVEGPAKMRSKDDDVEIVTIGALEIEALRRIQRAQASRSVETGATPPRDGWVLSSDGMGHRPRRPDRVGREMAAHGKRVGIQVSPHKLRHSMATEMLARGIDPGTVAERLHHSDPALTLRVYDHPDEKRGRAASEMLGALLKELTP